MFRRLLPLLLIATPLALAGGPATLVPESPVGRPAHANHVVLLSSSRETHERIGTLSIRMVTAPFGARGRSCKDNYSTILGDNYMRDLGQPETLDLTAPTAEGICEFVGRFPGQGMVKYGPL